MYTACLTLNPVQSEPDQSELKQTAVNADLQAILTCVFADGVILWTRITPRTVNETTASYNVTWTIYSGNDLSTVVQTGVSTTSAARDFTVKVSTECDMTRSCLEHAKFSCGRKLTHY